MATKKTTELPDDALIPLDVLKDMSWYMNFMGLSAEQQQRIKDYGFFEAPASSQYHLCHKGGLAEHTLNVIKTALQIRASMDLPLAEKEVVMAAFFHDMGKAKRYKPNILKSGLQSTAKPYMIETELSLPDCTDSLYAVIADLKIELPHTVIMGIIWQNGAFSYDFKKHLPDLAKKKDHMMMAWLIHTADMHSAWIKEHRDAKAED